MIRHATAEDAAALAALYAECFSDSPGFTRRVFEPVSYTHLDVYKRQIDGSGIRAKGKAARLEAIADRALRIVAESEFAR